MQKVGPLQLKKKITKKSDVEKRVNGLSTNQKCNELSEKKEELQQYQDNQKQTQFDPVEMAQGGVQGKTQAEMQYDLVRLKRLGEKIEKKMELTYRQKIEKFNKNIQKMPEHYDIPKVGPG